MAKEPTDLDILFPDVRSYTTFTAEDGETYKVRFFIPAELSLLTVKEGENNLSYQIRVLSTFLTGGKNKYEHMSEEWIKDNVSLQIQNVLFNKLLQEIRKSNELLGEAGERETPIKNPQE